MTDKPYKPFDLEKALAGEKFARKYDLKEPEEWHYFNVKNEVYNLYVVFDGDLCCYTKTGKRVNDNEDHYLVMLPKPTKKLWIGINLHQIQAFPPHYRTSFAYESKADLVQQAYVDTGYDLYEIEVEADE